VVLDQIDVHRPQREATAHDPDPFGDPLGREAVDPGAQPGAQVGQLGQPLLGGRAGRRQEAQLRGDAGRVEVGVVVGDQVLLDRHHVTALDVDSGAVGGEALEEPGAGERPARPPAHRGAVPGGGDVDDLEREVRKGGKQGAEVLAHPVGGDQLLLADEAIDRARLP
jgi:hypothetical protein